MLLKTSQMVAAEATTDMLQGKQPLPSGQTWLEVGHCVTRVLEVMQKQKRAGHHVCFADGRDLPRSGFLAISVADRHAWLAPQLHTVTQLHIVTLKNREQEFTQKLLYKLGEVHTLTSTFKSGETHQSGQDKGKAATFILPPSKDYLGPKRGKQRTNSYRSSSNIHIQVISQPLHIQGKEMLNGF